MSWSGTFTIQADPGSLESLRELCESLPVSDNTAKAALTCLSCGTAQDFHGHPTVKEAMVQIDNFRSAHAACSRKGRENDEQDRNRGAGHL